MSGNNNFWENYGKYRMVKDVVGGSGGGGNGGCLVFFVIIGLIVYGIGLLIAGALILALIAAVVFIFGCFIRLVLQWYIEGKKLRVFLVCSTLICIGVVGFLCNAYSNGILWWDTAKYHVDVYEDKAVNYVGNNLNRDDVAEVFDGYVILKGDVHDNDKWDNIYYSFVNNSFDRLSDAEICQYFSYKPTVNEDDIGSVWLGRTEMEEFSGEEDNRVIDFREALDVDGGDNYFCMGVTCNDDLYSGKASSTHCILYKNYEPVCLYNRETGALVYNYDDIPESAFESAESYPQSDFVGTWVKESSGSDIRVELLTAGKTILEIDQYENALLYRKSRGDDSSSDEKGFDYCSALPENNGVYEDYTEQSYFLKDRKLYEYDTLSNEPDIYTKTGDPGGNIQEQEYIGNRDYSKIIRLADRFCHLYMRRNQGISTITSDGVVNWGAPVSEVEYKIRYTDGTIKKSVVRILVGNSRDMLVLGMGDQE